MIKANDQSHLKPSPDDQENAFQQALTALDDITYLAGLSDLYAETHPDVLKELKTIKHAATNGDHRALTKEGRLDVAHLLPLFCAAPRAQQQQWLNRIDHAINRTLRATRAYSVPHPDKGLTERTIDALRVQLIRQQTDKDPTWLSCMLATADNTRLDRLEYQRAFYGQHALIPARHEWLTQIAATLDVLDTFKTPQTAAGRALADASYSDLYDHLALHIDRFEWTHTPHTRPDGEQEIFTVIKAKPLCAEKQPDPDMRVIHATAHTKAPMSPSKCLSLAAYHADDSADSLLCQHAASLALMLLSLTRAPVSETMAHCHQGLYDVVARHAPAKLANWTESTTPAAPKESEAIAPSSWAHRRSAPTMTQLN